MKLKLTFYHSLDLPPQSCVVVSSGDVVIPPREFRLMKIEFPELLRDIPDDSLKPIYDTGDDLSKQIRKAEKKISQLSRARARSAMARNKK